MQEYQRHFIEFLLKHKALKFGEFTLKSGRISPYFFNLGTFQSGSSLAKLGEYYAASLLQSNLPYDILYGPAYKGIPLVAATAIALSNQHEIDAPYCFNRKEAKDHGDKGLFVGAPLEGRIVMVDDVITAGTTVRETIELIQPYNADLTGIVIAFDRQERGQGKLSAVQETASKHGVPVQSIITLTDLINYLHQHSELKSWLKPIELYRAEYGV
ncbi:MAG: orotate phosphoribosyltransferase [Coxiellaceae bacterium]|nr:orotate phosphoribosyltransferase [Coxiellaceae bacterium]